MKIEYESVIGSGDHWIDWTDDKGIGSLDLDPPLPVGADEARLPEAVKLVWARLQSTDPTSEHPELRALLGRRVRVCIETVDEPTPRHPR